MNTLAQQLAKTHNVPFADTFRYQYVVSERDLGLPGFHGCPIGAVVLQTGEALKSQPLIDVNGVPFGCVIGVGVSHDGRSAADYLCAAFDANAPDAIAEFEDQLTRVSGRFAVVLHCQRQTRLYVDACGMIGAVFAPETRRVGATLGLCIDREVVTPQLFQDSPSAKPRAYGLHHTRDEAVYRLNPNHYLDLDTFKTHRFWPRAEDEFHLERDAYAAAFDELIDASAHIIDGLVREHIVSLPLSGGFDSRSIVAFARPESLRRLDQIFTHILTWINLCDASVANQLCAINNLGHETHNALRTRQFSGKRSPDAEEKQFQVACANFEPSHRFVRDGAARRVMRDAVVLRGQQMPILRGLFVSEADEAYWTSGRIAERIAGLLNFSEADDEGTDQIHQSVAALYAELPEPARRRALDLLLVEAVNGPELSDWFCGVSHNFYSSPYNSRRLIQLFSSFDTADRKSGLAMDLALLRASPVVKTVAMTPKVKTVQWAEDDNSVRQRLRRLNRLRREYARIFGEESADLPMIRYRRDGVIEYCKL